MTIEVLKRAAGGRAAEMVDDGMVVGLGSGSTSREATLAIGRRLRDGSLRDIVAVPTSEDTARLAKVEGIPLTTLDEHLQVDLTIDGADEGPRGPWPAAPARHHRGRRRAPRLRVAVRPLRRLRRAADAGRGGSGRRRDRRRPPPRGSRGRRRGRLVQPDQIFSC